ncbi:unnamed protein product [Microthlaspi erraticum]|uniref:Reverse transcriptase domain-containing protein n=1 Tax=Microthlaspi erraticum TaxID=1685480 RepID=A0A6D2LBN7_9BRAS|nr:unnamed protein product [Microthlaspi erraticum]
MRTKAAHDKLIRLKDFKVGDSVLLFNSKLRLFPGKLRSKWSGPFKIHEVLPYGSLTLLNQEGKEFIVNGHRGLASESQALEAIGSLLKLIHPTPMNSISRARFIGALSGPFQAISITSMWRIAYGHTSQG